jgi:hypothetical protein
MTDIRTLRRDRWTRVIAAPVGVVALVGLAACGTSTDTGATSTGTASSVAAEPSATDDGDDTDDTDLAAYRSCMEENGVTMPERPAGGAGARPEGGRPPQGGAPLSGAPAAGGAQGGAGQAPPGVDSVAWAAAQEACADLAPTPPDGTAPAEGSDT